MRILSLLIFVFFMASCQQQQIVKAKTTIDSISDYLSEKTKYFSLPYRINVTDSNELFFCHSERFDTSLLIHFKKGRNEIRGIVYQVVRGYFLVDQEEDGPQFFEGYSFKLDTIQWKSITHAADSLLMTEPGHNYEHAFDGSDDVLAFNSRVRFNNTRPDDSLLLGYLAYLKSTLLNQCLEKKPKWFITK